MINKYLWPKLYYELFTSYNSDLLKNDKLLKTLQNVDISNSHLLDVNTQLDALYSMIKIISFENVFSGDL